MSEHDGTPELTDVTIAQATREYYDARPTLGDAWDAEPPGVFPDIAPEQRRLESALCAAVQGRDVLEVACGTGQLTRLAAEGARSILAIDSSETCIRLARDGCSFPNVVFQVGDAFDLSGLPAGFSAGFASGFFHLVPKRRREEFLEAFHSRLAPGAQVFLCATHTRTLRAKRRRFRHPGSPDVLCKRELKDGRTYVIVNNEFDEAELRQVFGPVALNLRIEVGDAWWWVTYSI
jgi:SAM-dependent methyltransferase